MLACGAGPAPLTPPPCTPHIPCQVTITYGPLLRNDDLMLYYGFIEDTDHVLGNGNGNASGASLPGAGPPVTGVRPGAVASPFKVRPGPPRLCAIDHPDFVLFKTDSDHLSVMPFKGTVLGRRCKLGVPASYQ